MVELLPCPFCGKNATVNQNQNGTLYSIGCSGYDACGARILGDTRHIAVLLWNNRVQK